MRHNMCIYYVTRNTCTVIALSTPTIASIVDYLTDHKHSLRT